MDLNEDAFRFFQRLSGRLNIELSEPAHRITPKLANMAAPATARIVSVSMKFDVHENGKFRPLTEEELDRVLMRVPRIRMRESLEDVWSSTSPPTARLSRCAISARRWKRRREGAAAAPSGSAAWTCTTCSSKEFTSARTAFGPFAGARESSERGLFWRARRFELGSIWGRGVF